MKKSSKGNTSSSDIDDWIESASTFPRDPVWKSIPKHVLDEIDKVLAHNDTNPSKTVPQTAMLKRLREVHKIQITRGGLNHYLHYVLGRHWSH